MGEHKDHLTSALHELQDAGAISGMPKEPPEGFSKNARAQELLGLRRTDCTAFDQPCELGYHCPVCQYPQVSTGPDQHYDERLHWSEYESMIWCSVCNVDYPSCLCLPPGSTRATDIFLNSLSEAVHKGAEMGEADTRRMDYLEGEELTRGDTLFRRNMPITRATVDAAIAAEGFRDG